MEGFGERNYSGEERYEEDEKPGARVCRPSESAGLADCTTETRLKEKEAPKREGSGTEM